MKILALTTLFPNAVQRHHGIFVENRLRHLVEESGFEARIIAPVPWVPRSLSLPARYSAFAKVPQREVRHGLPIEHPRYLAIPKIGTSVAPFLLYSALKPVLRRVLDSGYDFDIIDAHYFYPDGVAAVMLARWLSKPVSVTARGTDLNLIPRYALPRHMIKWAATHADGLVTVCQALKDVLIRLNIDSDRIEVLRNGVDLDLFRPGDRKSVRKKFNLTHPTLLSIGHLIPRKGHDLIISALPKLPKFHLIIVGTGPEETALRRLANNLKVAERVIFLEGLPHEELPDLYTAADILVLASDREGWPNVLLEAMACGCPVIASNVWGNPEIVAGPQAGCLLSSRTVHGVTEAVNCIGSKNWDRRATRAYAENFSWEATTRGQISLFKGIIKKHQHSLA